MAKKGVEVGAMKIDPADERVALVCVVKAGMTAEEGMALDVARHGKFMRMLPGDWSPMLKDDANWHVKKASRYDATNPLALEIRPLSDMKEDANPEAERDSLILKAIEQGIISKKSEAKNMSVDELKALFN